MSYVNEDDIIVEREAMETLCGHRSADETGEDVPFPFVGCATVVVIMLVAWALVIAWVSGVTWKGVAG